MIMSPDRRPSASDYVKQVLSPLSTTQGQQSEPFKIDFSSPKYPYNQQLNFVQKKLSARRALDMAEAAAMGPGKLEGSPSSGTARFRTMRVRRVSDKQYKRWSMKTSVRPPSEIPSGVEIQRWPECRKHIPGAGYWGSVHRHVDTLGPLWDKLEVDGEKHRSEAEMEQMLHQLELADADQVVQVSEEDMRAIHEIRAKLIRTMATCFAEFGSGEDDEADSDHDGFGRLQGREPGRSPHIADRRNKEEEEEEAINAVAAELARSGELTKFSYNSPIRAKHPTEQGPSAWTGEEAAHSAQAASEHSSGGWTTYRDEPSEEPLDTWTSLPDTRPSPLQLKRFKQQQHQEQTQPPPAETQAADLSRPEEGPRPIADGGSAHVSTEREVAEEDGYADDAFVEPSPRNLGREFEQLPATASQATGEKAVEEEASISLADLTERRDHLSSSLLPTDPHSSRPPASQLRPLEDTASTTQRPSPPQPTRPAALPATLLGDIRSFPRKPGGMRPKPSPPPSSSPPTQSPPPSSSALVASRQERLQAFIHHMDVLRIPHIAVQLVQPQGLLGRGKYAAVYAATLSVDPSTKGSEEVVEPAAVAVKSIFHFAAPSPSPPHPPRGARVERPVLAMKLAQYATSNNAHDPPHAAIVDEFERELLALQRLQHPRIVHCFGYTLQPLGLVLEKVNGPNLYDCLQDSSFQRTAAEAPRWQLQCDLMDAVQHMHVNGFVHRDLKPHNVLVCQTSTGWRAKLADLGTAIYVGDVNARVQEKAVGTAGYTAPEILAGEAYGLPVDLFSCAVVLWEILRERETEAAEGGGDIDTGGCVKGNPLAAMDPSSACELLKQGGRPPFQSRFHRRAEAATWMEQCWALDAAARPTAAQAWQSALAILSSL